VTDALVKEQAFGRSRWLVVRSCSQASNTTTINRIAQLATMSTTLFCVWSWYLYRIAASAC